MLVIVLSILLFLVFMTLGGFHFYWLAGGTWSVSKVIPTRDNHTRALSPPKLATLFVALVLCSFGGMYLLKTGVVQFPIPEWIDSYGYWLVPGIFILRAIGEFNYVGFFKKIRHTEFAKADSNLFSPLCFAIGVVGILIQLI